MWEGRPVSVGRSRCCYESENRRAGKKLRNNVDYGTHIRNDKFKNLLEGVCKENECLGPLTWSARDAGVGICSSNAK